MKCFTMYSLPKIIADDNARQLMAKYIEEFWLKVGVKHHKVTMYVPPQNSLVNDL